MTNPPVIDEVAFRKVCHKVLGGRANESWHEHIARDFLENYLKYAPAGEQPEQAGDALESAISKYLPDVIGEGIHTALLDDAETVEAAAIDLRQMHGHNEDSNWIGGTALNVTTTVIATLKRIVSA